MIYKGNKINSSFFAYTYCNYPPLVHNVETQNKNSSGANMYNFYLDSSGKLYYLKTNSSDAALMSQKVSKNAAVKHVSLNGKTSLTAYKMAVSNNV
jgi:hypothetical protein